MPSGQVLPPSPDNIGKAAHRIAQGGIVAYPTETVFGLAVNPFDESALEQLFLLKQRPPDKPVLLLISEISELDLLAESTPPLARELMDTFWPGPLTLLLPARHDLSDYVTSGSETVAVRQSSNPTAHALCQAVGAPITSTSANHSSQPPATTSETAAQLLGNPEDLVLAGVCRPDAEPSTIVDATGAKPVIVREGVLSASDLHI